MDEMKIESEFARGMASSLIDRLLRRNLHLEDTTTNLNSIQIQIVDGKTHIHLDIDARISKSDLIRLLNGVESV